MSDQLCPKVESTLNLLGKKWIGLIIYRLLDGPKKFGEIEKYVPNLSARMLTERLKDLEKEEIVVKNIFNETPIRIEYTLTEKGKSLYQVFSELGKWAEEWN